MSARIIQWGSGTLGKIGIRHFVQNPEYDLVGLLVFSPEKDGVDAGLIAETHATGVEATVSQSEILELSADCVFYTPLEADLDDICNILRSGKNVVSTTGYFYPSASVESDFERIASACEYGKASYFGSGIHPGFAGDLLPLMLCRLNSAVNRVQVFEVVNFQHSGAGAAKYLQQMAFGVAPELFECTPNTLAESIKYFEQSMAMVAEGLGKRPDRFSASVEVGLAQIDMDFHGFSIPAGTVAAQHHEWTCWSEGIPLVTFHAIYTLGYKSIVPVWNLGDIHYRISIEGDPNSVVDLSGNSTPDSVGRPYGYVWTAMAALNAIDAVCRAEPGVLTNLDFGLVRTRGLVHQ